MIEKIKRKLFLKKITCNLGKVVETNDKIICFVKKRKCENKKYEFTIPCFGHRKNDTEITKKYNLNKPICYVIENLEVKNKKVFIFGYDNPEIIIRNCTFLYDVYGKIFGKCTLENTYIRAFSLFMFGANEFIIKNMNITNPFSSTVHLNIALGGEDKLEIINSTIGNEKQNTNVDLIARDNLIINSSNIGGDKVLLKGENVKSDNKSKIKASNELKLEAKQYDNLNITSSQTIINDETLEMHKETFRLKRITDEKELERMKLIDALRKIKENCEEKRKRLVEEYSKNLEEEKIVKLIK